MMNKVISSLFFALLVGAAAAFFRPVAPYQVPVEIEVNPVFLPRGGSSTFDNGLDNAAIPEDSNVTPSRKCGFCMGVSD
jgi:hypothetical protein